MSTKNLIASLEKLLQLHKSLYELAVKKTESIKIGDMEALNKILKKEQTHVTAITKLELERITAAKQLLPELSNPSLADCISEAEGIEQEQLLVLGNQLAEVVFELKEQNYLNEQLVQQSLQFVDVSMNLLRPQQQPINYTPPKGVGNKKIETKGLFNTKA